MVHTFLLGTFYVAKDTILRPREYEGGGRMKFKIAAIGIPELSAHRNHRNTERKNPHHS